MKELQKVSDEPTSLLQLAIEKGAPIEQLEKLMELRERYEAGESKKKFFKSLSEFQAKCPVINKNKKADFSPKSGGRVLYHYATLDQIISQIQSPLKDSGLSYRWKIDENGESIKVSCIITHESGHSETTEMTAKADTTGAKNEIQARGSSVTYLQRYTLIGALGIGTAQDDVDGNKPETSKDKKTAAPTDISEDVKKELQEIDNKVDLERHWKEHKSMQGFQPYINAIKKKKGELTNAK